MTDLGLCGSVNDQAKRLSYVYNPRSLKEGTETLRQSDWRNWNLTRDPNHLRVLTKQANYNWHACFALRTLSRSADIKGERVKMHISFLLRSRDVVPRPYSGDTATVATGHLRQVHGRTRALHGDYRILQTCKVSPSRQLYKCLLSRHPVPMPEMKKCLS